jgi:tRNA(Ile)-lysidine synthase
MAALAPSVAAIRVAVRRQLDRFAPGELVLVACSGGADSLALASAARFETERRELHCGLVTVDHGLQDGSADRAHELSTWARATGFSPVLNEKVTVGKAGGPEAAARDARYEALVAAAKRAGAAAVLLGHTRDDQAETVLLALTRGAGPRGLAGMPERRTVDGVLFVRPLLDIGRAETRAACAALTLAVWEDPHNTDPSYARARVRAALPALVATLGQDMIANLSRTARLLAADNEVLDDLAAGVATAAIVDGSLAVSALVDLPAAIRTRVLHGWARSLGAGGALSYRHVEALDTLVTDWRGQGPVALPGGVLVARRGGCLSVTR